MKRATLAGVFLLYSSFLALGIYELTAKSPRLWGERLPGWWASDRAENMTMWQQPTGVFPLDKLLHEGQEALTFYALLTGIRS
ncbi:MAG: hypothetical protein ACI9UK_002135 [Candidatus Krumholzibacteriia bacterium]|jgi:hypothetical protein